VTAATSSSAILPPVRLRRVPRTVIFGGFKKAEIPLAIIEVSRILACTTSVD
jgi:hypothetical protein